MSTYVLAAQHVNGDPFLSPNTSIIISAGTSSTLRFTDTDNSLGPRQPGESVSLDGGLTQLSYTFLGFGNVRNDPLQHACFIRINLANGTFLTVAIDMNRDADGLADLANGNTGLTANRLVRTPEPWPYPPCFVAGTLIRTPQGQVPVEEIAVGDLVETMDRGPQMVRWTCRRTVDGSGDHAPIRIATGEFGNDRPLLVSPNHRMLLTGWKAELLFGTSSILVTVKHLVGMKGIARAPRQRVEYVHLLFDRHEIIFAEGAPTESFHPGSCMLGSDWSLRQEIAAIFPELFLAGQDLGPARCLATRYEARALRN